MRVLQNEAHHLQVEQSNLEQKKRFKAAELKQTKEALAAAQVCVCAWWGGGTEAHTYVIYAHTHGQAVMCIVLCTALIGCCSTSASCICLLAF